MATFDHFWPAVFSQGTLVVQLVYCEPVPVGDLTSSGRFRYFPLLGSAWQVPESATQDDVAEEPVKSPEACGYLWTYYDIL